MIRRSGCETARRNDHARRLGAVVLVASLFVLGTARAHRPRGALASSHWRPRPGAGRMAPVTRGLLAGPLKRVCNWATDRVLRHFPEAGEPTPPQMDALRDAAGNRARLGLAQRQRGLIGSAHTVHESGDYKSLLQALKGPFRSIEGDVGVVRGKAVLHHDLRYKVGLPFGAWLEVVAKADFDVVKVDVKRNNIKPIIRDIRRAIREHGLDEARLKINADVFHGPGGLSELPLLARPCFHATMAVHGSDLIAFRAAFPRATIAISAWTTGPAIRAYDSKDVDRFLALGREVKGPVSFVLRRDLVTRKVVQDLAPHGQVDVWNRPDRDPASDVGREETLLRGWGVNGVIDLRQGPDSPGSTAN